MIRSLPSHRANHNPENALALIPPAKKKDLPPLDPLVTLQVAMDHHTGAETPLGSASTRSSIASVCFLPKQSGYSHNEIEKDDSSDDDSRSSSSSSSEEELQFTCRSLLQSEATSASDPTRQARQSAAATTLLSGRYLASCHANGECLLWDLNQQKIEHALIEPRGGPGWMLRRLPDSHFFYQTRDPRGLVSIHSWEKAETPIASFATFSQTFCAATPCRNNSNLLALPSSDDSEATVRDWRMDPASKPVAVVSGCGNNDNEDAAFVGRKHGMLTSLAFAESNHHHPILACGMESGTVFFHDLRLLSEPCSSQKLSDDPVLALDMACSEAGGVVAVAGMAGENLTQRELPEEQQGTVAILKATPTPSGPMKLRLRSRLATCRPQGPGKPGVSLCRFQPGEARLFAVGGWDRRVRILDRSSATQQPLRAILRGHEDSVNAIDWDSSETGLLATGAADGKIHVWRCFSSTK